MMKWWMAVAIAVTAVRTADAETDPFTIDLQLKNEARAPSPVVEHCQQEVSRIFSDAGLAVHWTDTAPRVTVKVVSQVLGFDRASSPVMGVARHPANGSMAQVFFKQVQDFARVYDVDLGRMLAYVIAHEVGHLLLFSSAHSSTGVMPAEWDR